jgi:hypothetical protein
MKRTALLALLAAAAAISACTAPNTVVIQEARVGKITKIDDVPVRGDRNQEQAAGQRIVVLLRNAQVVKVTQDADPALRVGDIVRIETTQRGPRVVKQ